MYPATVRPADPQTSDAAPASRRLRVETEGLVKRYTSRKSEVVALNRVSLSIRPGEMVVLLGPSGCGKTTLLRSIAGLEQPEMGRILLDGKTVYCARDRISAPPEQRRLSMVFQSYALWPHMSVFENIAYPLRSSRMAKSEVERQVSAIMDKVGLAGYAERLPSQLSGGQQQRVALARALVADVGLILFDEPLSNVDAKVREQVRRELVDLQKEFGFAGLYVTHDQVEAGAIADTLVVMDSGEIVQAGPPQELYQRPATRYVANFMGSTNEVNGQLLSLQRVGQIAPTWAPFTARSVRRTRRRAPMSLRSAGRNA